MECRQLSLDFDRPVWWIFLLYFYFGSVSGASTFDRATTEQCLQHLAVLERAHLAFAEALPHATNSEAIRAAVTLNPTLRWLTKDVSGSPEDESCRKIVKDSPSFEIFGEKFCEFDRTAGTLIALKQILGNEYDSFVKDQPSDQRLSRKSFDEIRQMVAKVLPDPEAIDAMIVFMSIHDIGKVKRFQKLSSSISLKFEIDHDRILLEGLKAEPLVLLDFERLSDRYKKMIFQSMESDFNMGQFLQGENLPIQLSGIQHWNAETMSFYQVHLLLDIAGSAAAKSPGSALAMTESVYQSFRDATDSLNGFSQDKGTDEIYDDFLIRRAKTLGLNFESELDLALVRLACMTRSNTPKKAQMLRGEFMKLPKAVKSILVRELRTNARSNALGIMIYYGPAFFSNLERGLLREKTPLAEELKFSSGLFELARIYQEARIHIKSRSSSGVFLLDINDFARRAEMEPFLISRDRFHIEPVGDHAILEFESNKEFRNFEGSRLKSLRDIPGRTVAMIGLGGGTDGVQAAQIGKELIAEGKKVPLIVSIQRATTSQGVGRRVIENHGGEVAPGVFRILPETTGRPRFVEDIIASDFHVYVIVDDGNHPLAPLIKKVLDIEGGIDSIFGVDTGGDGLIPDGQDYRSLKAIQELKDKYSVKSFEISVGIDSPENAIDILEKAEAEVFQLSDLQIETIIRRSENEWALDARDPEEEKFGKTPLAWLSALRGEWGMRALHLPDKVVLHTENPWNPFVFIQPMMQKIFVMDIDRHLQAMESHSHQ